MELEKYLYDQEKLLIYSCIQIKVIFDVKIFLLSHTATKCLTIICYVFSPKSLSRRRLTYPLDTRAEYI